jgi:steroid delta-isomerase-like uncharacterized protein
MSVENTRQVVSAYLHGHDTNVIADDAVFAIMDIGQEHKGREAIIGMLDYFYNVAFDATAETRNLIIADGQAVLEADFAGKHIGDFGGIPATGKEVHVPLCVVYEVEGDKIKRGRVYWEFETFRRQVTG